MKTEHGPVCVITKVSLSYNVTYSPITGTVDRVKLTGPVDRSAGGAASALKIDIVLRSVITFDVGNKATTRYGQKGVNGRIVEPADLPFDPVTGLVASVVISPHGTISRMFPGSLKDVLVSIHASVVGVPWIDASDSAQVSNLEPILAAAIAVIGIERLRFTSEKALIRTVSQRFAPAVRC